MVHEMKELCVTLETLISSLNLTHLITNKNDCFSGDFKLFSLKIGKLLQWVISWTQLFRSIFKFYINTFTFIIVSVQIKNILKLVVFLFFNFRISAMILSKTIFWTKDHVLFYRCFFLLNLTILNNYVLRGAVLGI